MPLLMLIAILGALLTGSNDSDEGTESSEDGESAHEIMGNGFNQYGELLDSHEGSGFNSYGEID